MSLPGKLVSIDGVRVYVHRAGKARPGRPVVVLLHGLLLSHWSFRGIIPALLEAGEEVLTFDFPGFGESDRPPPHLYPYDGEHFAATLLNLLDALHVPRAALVGHSLGGGVAIAAAARKSDKITRLALLAPICFRSRLPALFQLVRAPLLGPALVRGAMTRKNFCRLMRDYLYWNRDPDPADVDFLWERLWRPGGVEALHAAWRFATDPEDVERCIRAVRVPTVILWGARDRLVPPHWADRLAAQIPGARSRVIEGAAHALHEEQPDQVLSDLLPFLQQRPLSWA